MNQQDNLRSKLKSANKEISLPKKIGIDILGGLLIFGSILFGWLPGPGGIPLFIAGLSLLSINHAWARRILVRVKDNGNKLADIIFKDHPTFVLAYDIIAVIMIILAGVIFGLANGNLVRGLTIALVFLGISLFLGNRNRIQHINNFVRRVANRSTKP